MCKIIALLMLVPTLAFGQENPEDTPPTPGVDVPLDDSPQQDEDPPQVEAPPTPADQQADPDQPLTQQFEQTLSPYGSWVDIDGQRVWQPSQQVVGDDFVPYTSNGTWAYSNYGWSFQSQYPWGWAAFHYGRWWRHASYGWVWYPGSVWGSSWVSWRYGGGYVGWTPLAPARFSRWTPTWNFCNTNQFVMPGVHRYVVPYARIGQVWGATQPSLARVSVAGRPWFAGPSVHHVGNAMGGPPPRVSVAPMHGAAPRYYPHAPQWPQRPMAPQNAPNRAMPHQQNWPAQRAPSYQSAPQRGPSYQSAPQRGPSYQSPPQRSPSYQNAPQRAPSYQNAPHRQSAYAPPSRGWSAPMGRGYSGGGSYGGYSRGGSSQGHGGFSGGHGGHHR